jgi:hypothetical protein
MVCGVRWRVKGASRQLQRVEGYERQPQNFFISIVAASLRQRSVVLMQLGIDLAHNLFDRNLLCFVARLTKVHRLGRAS